MTKKNARAKRKCNIKINYTTQTDAVKAIKRIIMNTGRPSPLKSYKCSIGKHWHLATYVRSK